MFVYNIILSWHVSMKDNIMLTIVLTLHILLTWFNINPGMDK